MNKGQEMKETAQKKYAAISLQTGIKVQVLREIEAFAEKHSLEKLVLFGSRARGDFRERSDIDLAVYGGNFAQFSLDVDGETWTLLKYDFVDMSQTIQPELKASIEKEGVVLYEKV